MTESGGTPGSGSNVRLRDFEKKVRLRQLTLADYPALVTMQERCFPAMQTWARDQIESQLERFPEGQICLEVSGRLVASSSSLVVVHDR